MAARKVHQLHPVHPLHRSAVGINTVRNRIARLLILVQDLDFREIDIELSGSLERCFVDSTRPMYQSEAQVITSVLLKRLIHTVLVHSAVPTYGEV